MRRLQTKVTNNTITFSLKQNIYVDFKQVFIHCCELHQVRPEKQQNDKSTQVTTCEYRESNILLIEQFIDGLNDNDMMDEI